MQCSGDRAINGQHRAKKPAGNTVDINTAKYTDSIGDALVMVYWKDPDFDPAQRTRLHLTGLVHTGRTGAAVTNRCRKCDRQE
jgi:hypothetical protein